MNVYALIKEIKSAHIDLEELNQTTRIVPILSL
jgi:hypothetical protein